MTDHGDSAVVRHPWGYHVFLWTVFPLAGVLVAWILTLVPSWIDGLSWVPFQGPIDLLDQLTGRVGTSVLLVIGAVLGGVVALTAYDEVIRVDVGTDAVTITHGDDVTTATRSSVGGVFADGKDLVLIDPSGGEMARKTNDLAADKLKQAFLSKGYPWHDVDPFAGQYVRWVDGVPGLPDGADAYLQARQRAIEKGDKDDARDLRTELGGLGVVVRDEKKKQYWRSVGGS